MRRPILALVVVLCSASILGCDLDDRRVLVWHDWPEPEAQVLTELLTSYSELRPDLHLIVEYVPAEDIERRFTSEVGSGFGPDVLIGADADRLPELIEADAVHPISSDRLAELGFDELNPRAMQAMAIDGDQLGIPLAGFTDVLYFREGVAPPETLDDIIGLAEDGHTAGIPIDFMRSYWGVDAFEGTVFGPDSSIAPDRGFVEWMQWLVDARPQPNVIIDSDYDTLRDYFSEGRIDLFIGGSQELATFRDRLRRDDDASVEAAGPESDPDATTATHGLTDVDDVTFGLTTLPAGVNEETGGLLEIEGMVVNRHTDSLEESLDLIEYLTNVPSQGRIARSGLGRIPINGAVSIDPTISPMEAALVVQQRRSVVLPRPVQAHAAELRQVGNEIYLQVARGTLEPIAAARLLGDRYDELLEVAG